MINVIENVDIMNDIGKYDAILVGTNVYCNLSDGLQRDIALNYPYTREQNFKTRYGDIDKLGTILRCEEKDEPLIVLLYVCRGFPPRLKKGELIDYLSYESLEKCLKEINILYKGMNVAMPMIGCSRFDGNGNKEKVMEIINNTLSNVNCTVYDYKQLSRSEKLKAIRDEELRVKSVDYGKYHEMVKKRKEEAEKRFERNGFARY